ncbi:class II aldolase/adducin family protein [Ruegeria sp. 2012CJ41-6]|uniref:Class II aldolase/adducin family protein n=1 Tax=Ruegeria spongiae TaxID=2942209 RepID=A0ABT0QAA3_9RHOB|nr:class II aldolase/adducin family protein [Ruegeria spongiae]MCL6286093.1 class II aldolase/adducin family protein [Ruegeria spongiae]
MSDTKVKSKQSKTSSEEASFWPERVDLAAAFRWAARFDMHEAVGNHFSLSVNDDGSKFLMNPNLSHFELIRASDLVLVDANDKSLLGQSDVLDATAWGLHGSLHRRCPHIRCAFHLHPTYSTALASLADSRLPPIDQNSMAFYDRVIIDENYGGIALEEEGERCAAMLNDPKIQVMVMGNHGILVVGSSVNETFTRLYYFERAVRNYILAISSGKPLRIVSDEIATKTANGIEKYFKTFNFLAKLRLILDKEGSDYAT